MKVAIDSGPLTSGHAVRGVGTYTRELIKEIKRLSDQDNKLKVDTFDFSTEHRTLNTVHYDLVHYPTFNPYFITLPLTKKTKTVVTIHDLIYLIYPNQYPPGIRGTAKFLLNKILVRKVDAIITVSKTSKKDIVRFLGIPAEKINVIYEAPRKIFRKLESGNWNLEIIKKYTLPKSFVLYVGDVNYNKNLLNLAEACNIAKIPLVLVGKQTTDKSIDLSHVENQSFAEFLNRYSRDSNILRLGFVPDEDLVAIYNLALVYCQPSFYEGFGLSILEAMACGTPVVAAKTQALVEISDGACLFVNPKDPKDIATKLKDLAKDTKLRKQLSETGKVLVKNYSWEKTARETLRVYRNVLTGKNQ